jgi:hypothetical protein
VYKRAAKNLTVEANKELVITQDSGDENGRERMSRGDRWKRSFTCLAGSLPDLTPILTSAAANSALDFSILRSTKKIGLSSFVCLWS